MDTFQRGRRGDVDEVDAPFTMLLARPTPYDVDALLAGTDDLTYQPERQVNVGRGDPLSMGRSTCFRRNSTGMLFLDNDRSQDD